MSYRISDSRLVLALALALVPACTKAVSIDVCGRGDQANLVAALAGGHLSVAFRDSGGHALTTLTAPVDQAADLTTSVPGEAVNVRVTGLGADGSTVASGQAPLEAGGTTCVCVALSAQQTASCSGLACRLVNGQCAFYDVSTGAPAATRTILLGENERDDLQNVTADTYLVNDSTHINDNFGSDKIISPDGSPPQVALLRFELTGIPKTAVIEQAELTLQETDSGGADVEFYRVLEAWDEGDKSGAGGCASWNCRMEGVPWTVPGCGYTDSTHRSRAETSLGTMPPSTGKHSLEVTATVAGWVAAPTTNFGFAMTESNSDGVDFASHEAAATLLRPELTVHYHLPE
jgi:hypothetical protein